MDAHIPRAIALGLRLRTVDVLTAQEDGAATWPDPALLDRATQLNRVLFTFDADLLIEAHKRLQQHEPFSGLIYAHPLRITIEQCVQELELIAKAGILEDIMNRIEFLPL